MTKEEIIDSWSKKTGINIEYKDGKIIFPEVADKKIIVHVDVTLTWV